MRFTILAAIVPLLSLTVAQGNWNCKNSDDPEYMKMDLQHRQASPNGLCVNDGGLGLLAHRCTAVRRSLVSHVLMLILVLGKALQAKQQWYIIFPKS
ncbi:hypothetical protein COCVIDRAFT_95815 [Bipolaris victoriae FI3]|uniref:Cyanovirin-N domain-containing protein n=1 Tax=Bipolaris victoriae (strain FI3) TaxID=930091 RepID=W7ED92_BIPV3|nr:hypothetical protein COCVIDRAFT_95815 [Bipolaris victoriae FI3]